MNYAIYCRCANEDIFSISNQCYKCLREILEIGSVESNIIISYDNGVPAPDDFSPRFLDLLKKMARKEIKFIYVYDVTRLTRNFHRLMTLQSILKQIGGDIYIVSSQEYLYKDILSKFPPKVKLVDSKEELELERE